MTGPANCMGATVAAKYDLSSHILSDDTSGAGEIGDGDAVEQLVQARVHPAPHRGQVAGGTLVDELLGREVAHRGERAVDGEQDLPHRDRGRRAGQARTPAGTTVGVHDPGAAQLGQDVLEEVLRDLLARWRSPGR